jgi:protein-tyrosine phosphatase
MGNICRSPTAEAVFCKLASDAGRSSDFEIDSAGTIDYHAGHPADSRMRATAKVRGYSLDSIARRVERRDFEHFDLIVAMDDDNFQQLTAMNPGSRSTVVRMCDYCENHQESEVPDPYYGGEAGFQIVIDILEDACGRLLREN